MRFAPLLTAAVSLFLAVSAVRASDRIIYLTFDDGPLTGTENILDVLEAEKVPAAMFMVGKHAEASAAHRALVERAKSLPHVTVGNHSYSHAHDHYRHFYADTEGVVADMMRANEVLGLTAKPVQARLPGRDVFRLPDVYKDDLSIGKTEDEIEQIDFEFVSASGFNPTAGITNGSTTAAASRCRRSNTSSPRSTTCSSAAGSSVPASSSS